MTREEAIQYLTDTGISPEHIMELVEALEQETAPLDLELYQAGLMDMPKGMIEVLDKIRAEFQQLASRYTISRERGGMGQVEWADRLIKESEVLQIIDKYRKEQE